MPPPSGHAAAPRGIKFPISQAVPPLAPARVRDNFGDLDMVVRAERAGGVVQFLARSMGPPWRCSTTYMRVLPAVPPYRGRVRDHRGPVPAWRPPWSVSSGVASSRVRACACAFAGAV